MKTLVIGCNGQLGHSLAVTAPENVGVIGFDLPELDITDASAVLEVCRETRPDMIVNAAAYTAVDKAETDVALAMAVNVEGPRNVAAASLDVGARLIHISTDFVFDGESSAPYKADVATNPLSVYGLTKRDGELAVLEESSGAAVVIRTSWLYSKTGTNFVKTMLRLMGERDELSIVADQIGTPTWADSLAAAVWAFVDAPEQCGIFSLDRCWQDKLAGIRGSHSGGGAVVGFAGQGNSNSRDNDGGIPNSRQAAGIQRVGLFSDARRN